MKTIKFKDFKAKWVLEGVKTSTMRLFDDKDLQEGDELELIDSDSGKIFSRAVITEVISKKLDEIDDVDLDGHEKWGSKDEMLESLKKYYGDKVDWGTMVKVIKFKLLKPND